MTIITHKHVSMTIMANKQISMTIITQTGINDRNNTQTGINNNNNTQSGTNNNNNTQIIIIIIEHLLKRISLTVLQSLCRFALIDVIINRHIKFSMLRT